MHRDYEEIANELSVNVLYKAVDIPTIGIVCSWFFKPELAAYVAGDVPDIGCCNAVISEIDGHDPKLFRARSEKAISLVKKGFKEAIKRG